MRVGSLSRKVRLAIALLLAAAAFEGLYLCAANLVLRSPALARRINRKAEKLRIEWDKAWTVFPGRVHVENLRIRGQNRHIQWFTSGEQVQMTIRPLELFLRDFTARRVRARGFVFRLAPRLDGDHVEGVEPALLSPIPGFTNPPSPKPEEIYTRSGNPPWVVRLHDIAIEDVRQIWIEQFDYEGDGTIGGSFRFKIRNDVEVEQGEIRLKGGVLRAGPRLLAEKLEARLAGDLARFHLQTAEAIEAFGHLTATLDVDSRVSSLAFISLYMKQAPWLSFDGEGDLHAALAVERGRFTPQSRIDLSAPRAIARWPHYEASGSGVLEGRMVARPSGAVAELKLDFGDFDIRRPESNLAVVRGKGLGIAAVVHDPVLGTGFQQLDVTTSVADSRVVSFDMYNYYLPPKSGIAIRRGSGALSGRLELQSATQSGSGDVELTGEAVEMQFEDTRIVGDLRVRGRMRELPRDGPRDPAEYAFDVAGSSVELEHVQVLGREPFPDGGWSAKLEIEQGSMTLGEPLRLRARIRGAMADSRPVVAVFAEKNKLIDWFEGLFAVEDVGLSTDLELGRTIGFRNLDVEGQEMELRGTLQLGEGGKEGLLYIRFGSFSIGVELEGDERDYKLLNARSWFERRLRSGGPPAGG